MSLGVVRPHGVPPRLSARGRGGAEVLPARLVRRGAPALRLRAPLRRHRAHRSRRHRRRARGRRHGDDARAGARRARRWSSPASSFKVSAVPVPHVDARRLRRRAHAGDDYMAVAVKSGAFAMMLRVLLLGLRRPESTLVGRRAGRRSSAVARRAHHDGRQPHRRPARVGEAHARVLEHRPRRLRARRRGRHDARTAARRAQASVLFYLLAYTVSTAGAFGALILCGSRGAEAVSYEDLAGIGKRHPAAALAFSLFLAVARRRAADRGLLRQVVHLPRGDGRGPLLARRHPACSTA